MTTITKQRSRPTDSSKPTSRGSSTAPARTTAAQRAAKRNQPSAAARRSVRRGGLSAELYAELVESVREGGRILRGEQAPARSTTIDADSPDVTAIRDALQLSQTRFAALLGISVRTLQGWEQGRREPRGAERALLRVAARQPEALLAALG